MWVSSMLVKSKFSADAVDAICQPLLGQKLKAFVLLNVVIWI